VAEDSRRASTDFSRVHSELTVKTAALEELIRKVTDLEATNSQLPQLEHRYQVLGAEVEKLTINLKRTAQENEDLRRKLAEANAKSVSQVQ
jgi:predicted RNase H-like nuclease (RuvC/YqgF family)